MGAITSKVSHVSCSNLFFILLIISYWIRSILAEKKSKCSIYFDFTSIISPFWRDNFFHVCCSNLYCMLLITSSRTSSIMAEKVFKWLIYFDFSHFKSIIRPSGQDNYKSFSCILLKFILHVANNQFSD